MNISYLITVSNETDTLNRLLSRVSELKSIEDEVIIVQDESFYDETSQTNKIINKHFKSTYYTINPIFLTHKLNNNYSEHKNWGAKQCKNEWIMQLDGDECPAETLLLNIKDIIQANTNIESFWVPRINDFKGVTIEHAKKWGWRLTMSPTYKRLIVNWCDPQCRIFLNKPEIKWEGKLHEHITGNKNYIYLPADEDLALYHDKTIEKQIETNVRYNKLFTEKENKGFTLPRK